MVSDEKVDEKSSHDSLMARSVRWSALAATQQERVRRDSRLRLVSANAFVCRAERRHFGRV